MEIMTERLILRPFRLEDAKDAFEYLEHPESKCFLEMKLGTILEAREEMKKRQKETEYYFAITLTENGKVIGEIEAYPEPSEPHDARETSPHDTFSPCWMLNRKYQNKGYAYEAAHAFWT